MQSFDSNEGMDFLYPHHLEQWWMSIGCEQAILLICYIFVYDFLNWKKMPPHFWVETKLKNLDGFLIQFELVDVKFDNVISKGVESSIKFNLVVLENRCGLKMEAVKL